MKNLWDFPKIEVSTRNKQTVLWADAEFKKLLERIKAKRTLNGNPVLNLGQLTKEILKCPSFKKVKQELERMQQ